MNCRFCGHPLQIVLVDLKNAPPSNSFLTEDQLDEPEIFYPLKVYVCDDCFLVQIAEYKKYDAIFDANYAYFSSYSTSWLEHARRYTEMMIKRFDLSPAKHRIVEIASNDGYLLQYFLQRGFQTLGIEPTHNTAQVARTKGIPTHEVFFSAQLAAEMAEQKTRADILIGNNVLAHVPDLNDFVRGLYIILQPNGVMTMEFPHLLRLVQYNQFDTIYHEHFSYFSFSTVQRIFAAHGLTLFDVQELETHGSSLRIFAQRADSGVHAMTSRVADMLAVENKAGILTPAFYQGFQARCYTVKNDLLKYLTGCMQQGLTVAAYGAAAKGNTLLNYCGIKSDLIPFVVDQSPHKQGKYLPGSHIPIVSEERLQQEKPDIVLILPWNLQTEITQQLAYIRTWGGRFAVPVPNLQVW